MEEKARSFSLHCLPRLQWKSGIGGLQKGLGGSPVAVPECISWLCLLLGQYF